MLLSYERLIDVPVMGLQTGTEIARTSEPIIDPRNMSIPAFYVTGPQLDHDPSVLHTSDIREMGEIGFIVDDSSVLMELDGLVRLNDILSLNFQLIGLPVYDQRRHHLGKVIDCAFEPSSFTIEQIHTSQSLLRSLSSASNIIRRSQILEVTTKYIVVESPTIRDRVTEHAKNAGAMVNPFRGSATNESSSRETH